MHAEPGRSFNEKTGEVKRKSCLSLADLWEYAHLRWHALQVVDGAKQGVKKVPVLQRAGSRLCAAVGLTDTFAPQATNQQPDPMSKDFKKK